MKETSPPCKVDPCRTKVIHYSNFQENITLPKEKHYVKTHVLNFLT